MSHPKWSGRLQRLWSFVILSDDRSSTKIHSIKLTWPLLTFIRSARSSRKLVCVTTSHCHVNILSPITAFSSNNSEPQMGSVHQLQSLNISKLSKSPGVAQAATNHLVRCC